MTDSFADAGAPVDDAVDQAAGPLLADRDVTEIAALEGGLLEVIRRGRRERLDALLEGPLFELLRDGGADKGVVRLRLRGGARLVAAALVDGRIALRIEKSSSLDATVERLTEEGTLPPGIGNELCNAMLEGVGVLVLGPSRPGRQRLVGALVRALQARLAWYGVTDTLAPLVPVALDRTASVVDKARAAVLLGADALCALELTPEGLLELQRGSLGAPLLASVTSSSMDALQAALGVPVAAVAGQSAVIGFDPQMRPRLVELHGPARGDADVGPPPAPMPSRGNGVERTPAAGDGLPAFIPAEVSGLRERPRAEDPLPSLTALPPTWASDSPDDDPGWELGGEPSAPPAPGSFDAALAKQKTKPSFAPRPPRPHPQAGALRGDPFGGLTFEPPPGGPEGAEGSHGDGDGDDDDHQGEP